MEFNFLDQGKGFDFLSTGMMIFGAGINVCNIKILIFSNTYNPVSLFLIFGSIGFYVMNFFVFNLFKNLVSYNIFRRFGGFFSGFKRGL